MSASLQKSYSKSSIVDSNMDPKQRKGGHETKKYHRSAGYTPELPTRSLSPAVRHTVRSVRSASFVLRSFISRYRLIALSRSASIITR